MTDSILRSFQYYSQTSIVPFPAPPPETGANLLLENETEGWAFDMTTFPATISIVDTGTPANDLDNVAQDAGNLVNDGASPKLCEFPTSPFVRWAPHNLFINSATPATQNVTLVTGFVYTYGITGTGSLAGTSGASGTATSGSPVTFTATGTTGTFTVTGSPTTMQINRGSSLTDYLASGASQRFGIPITYDSALAKYGMWVEPTAILNICLYSDDFTQADWTKSNMTTAKTATGPDAVANSASTLTATAGNATALQSITSASTSRISSVWIKRRTGSGTVNITHDNGTTWTAVTVTSDWTRVKNPLTTAANPIVGIRIVTSGDAVDVFGFQHEENIAISSTIPTVGASQTRASDVIYALHSTFPWDDGPGTTYLDYTFKWPEGVTPTVSNSQGKDASNNTYVWVNFNGGSTFVEAHGLVGGGFEWNANRQFAIGQDSERKLARAVATNDMAWLVGGGTPTTDATVTLGTGWTHTYFGRRFGGTSAGPLLVHQYMYLPRRMSNSDMQTLTT